MELKNKNAGSFIAPALSAIFILAVVFAFTDPAVSGFFRLPQKIKGIRMDRNFNFAGEEIPWNEDTRERLDRELTINAYWTATTLLHVKMAIKHLPRISEILAENGIPDDFKYLAVAESSLRNATSSASAKGFWQFMQPAGEEMGLEISEDVDERFHFEKSTHAACQYIKKLKSRFGTWTNVAAAYNIGPTKFAQKLAEQKENSYYSMHLNEETSRYVFRIVAIKEILGNPSDFGYELESHDEYVPLITLKEVEVMETIQNLADFAHQHQTTYRLLKYYNPWLVSGKLTVKPGKKYLLKIPV